MNPFASNTFASHAFSTGAFRGGVLALLPIKITKLDRARSRLIHCGPAGAAPYCPPWKPGIKDILKKIKEKERPFVPKITEKRTTKKVDRVRAAEVRALKARLHNLENKMKEMTRKANVQPKRKEFKPHVSNWRPPSYAPRRAFAPFKLFQELAPLLPPPEIETPLPAVAPVAAVERAPVTQELPWIDGLLEALPWTSASTVLLIGTVWLVPKDSRVLKALGYGGSVALLSRGIHVGLKEVMRDRTTSAKMIA